MFNLKRLQVPTIGLKMARRQVTVENNILQYIRIPIMINDVDGVISGSDWGEYELHVYKYKDNKANISYKIFLRNIL